MKEELRELRRDFRRMEYFLTRYWFPLSTGFFTGGMLMIIEREQRGYFAVGGEFLIPAAFCIVHGILRNIIRVKRKVNGGSH